MKGHSSPQESTEPKQNLNRTRTQFSENTQGYSHLSTCQISQCRVSHLATCRVSHLSAAGLVLSNETCSGECGFTQVQTVAVKHETTCGIGETLSSG